MGNVQARSVGQSYALPLTATKIPEPSWIYTAPSVRLTAQALHPALSLNSTSRHSAGGHLGMPLFNSLERRELSAISEYRCFLVILCYNYVGNGLHSESLLVYNGDEDALTLLCIIPEWMDARYCGGVLTESGLAPHTIAPDGDARCQVKRRRKAN